MAGEMTNYLEDGILNTVFRGVTFPTLSGSLYVALFTAAPSDAGGGTEVSGGGYARVGVTRATGSWTAPANDSGAQKITNVAAITFPESTAAWGTVTHAAVFDAPTSGNMLYWAALSPSRAVDDAGITISIPAGSFSASQS